MHCCFSCQFWFFCWCLLVFPLVIWNCVSRYEVDNNVEKGSFKNYVAFNHLSSIRVQAVKHTDKPDWPRGSIQSGPERATGSSWFNKKYNEIIVIVGNKFWFESFGSSTRCSSIRPPFPLCSYDIQRIRWLLPLELIYCWRLVFNVAPVYFLFIFFVWSKFCKSISSIFYLYFISCRELHWKNEMKQSYRGLSIPIGINIY